jgi:Flp pilus assembly CpaF family ATPase
MLFDIINKMGQQLGKHITLQNPRLDTILPDGSRLHASLSPISGGEITIRKFRSEPYSLGELVKNETIEPKVAALLSLLMQNDHSIVVGGNTASGKTTTLNSLFSFVSQRERIIITEETPEINIPHPHQLRLVANRDLQIDLEGLVHDTMRMRPDRLIVGEIRKQDEFEALFEVLLSGQARGSYATMHAQSGIEALARMKNMGVSPTDLESIDCIIIQKRMQKYDPINKRNNEVRRIVEIAEVEEEMAKTIYRLGEVDEIYQSSIFTKICSEFSMDKNQMIDYLKQRQTIIMPNNENYLEYHKRIQRELFDD